MKLPQRTLIAWALALGIAFHTLLPFFAFYHGQSQPSALASLFGDKVLICTASGFQWVSLEDIQNGTAPAPHTQFFCPLCVIASGPLAKIIIAAALIFALQRQYVRLAFSMTYGRIHARPVWCYAPCRAPPAARA